MSHIITFPHVIDNSMRKSLVRCQKMAHWQYEMGLRLPEPEVHKHAGAAFAKGLEVFRLNYYGGVEFEKALELGRQALVSSYGNFEPPETGSGSVKTVGRLCGALVYYANVAVNSGLKPVIQPDGEAAMIEVGFSFPMGLFHPDDGKELIYTGRFDMLAEDENGDVWVVDEKLGTMLGEKWPNQWPLDAQMTGYVFGAQRLLDQFGVDKVVRGAIVNGVAILKYDYDHVECKTYREQWQLDVWRAQLQRDVEGWIEAYKKQNHNQVLDHACAMYNNPCEYQQLCLSRNPERLMQNYSVVFWDPRSRTETKDGYE